MSKNESAKNEMKRGGQRLVAGMIMGASGAAAHSTT